MQQKKLKSFISKLGLVSLYLLFLSVQLNLKYTFSGSIISDYPASTQPNGNNSQGAALEKQQPGKSVVQKLRLNKRYVHQDFFLIATIGLKGIQQFYIKVDETVIPVPPTINSVTTAALLRGPPACSC